MLTQRGWTALTVASENGHPDVVKALLLDGADKDTRNNVGLGAKGMSETEKHAW